LPEALLELQINVRAIGSVITNERIKNDIKYLNCLKPMILKAALSTTNGPCAIVDTDTYFIKDPTFLFASIGRGCSAMHVMEHPFTFRQALDEYIRSMRFDRTDVINKYFLNSSMSMWNSGIVGIDRSDMGLLDKILSLQEYLQLDERYPEHERIFIEQTATCSVLQANTQLFQSDCVVMHYWFVKRFVGVLQKFFKGTYGQLFPCNDDSGSDKICEMEILRPTFQDLPESMIRIADKHFSLKVLAENICLESTTGRVLHEVMSGASGSRGLEPLNGSDLEPEILLTNDDKAPQSKDKAAY
jgi:hypothetical protein